LHRRTAFGVLQLAIFVLLLHKVVGAVIEEDVIIAAETGDAVGGAAEGAVTASGTGSVVGRKVRVAAARLAVLASADGGERHTWQAVGRARAAANGFRVVQVDHGSSTSRLAGDLA